MAPPVPSDPAAYAAKDIGWQALGPALGCTALATWVVVTRWYTRLMLSRCHGLDDLLITVSLAVSWAMTGVIAAEVSHGVGIYSNDRRRPGLSELVVVANDLWVLTINITKVSILAQYLRIFQGRRSVLACYILLAALVPATLWGILGGTLPCRPIAKLWNPEIPGHCMSPAQCWLSAAAIDIALDFLVLVLPLPAIFGLHLARKQKVMLTIFFLLGFVVCAVSIVRLASVVAIAATGDVVRSGIWAIIWSTVEANVGIVCASLLALKPLALKYWPWMVEERDIPRHSMRIRGVEQRMTAGSGTSQEPMVQATTTNITPPPLASDLQPPRLAGLGLGAFGERCWHPAVRQSVLRDEEPGPAMTPPSATHPPSTRGSSSATSGMPDSEDEDDDTTWPPSSLPVCFERPHDPSRHVCRSVKGEYDAVRYARRLMSREGH